MVRDPDHLNPSHRNISFIKILHKKAQIKLARLGAATSILDLKEIRGNRFEKLKIKGEVQFSIRINDQYRICFRWEKDNAVDVEIIDYH